MVRATRAKPAAAPEAGGAALRAARRAPAHLRWATAKDNAADQRIHFGGQHSNALLTVAQVREILSQPHHSAPHLAAHYGVTSGTIDHIRHKRNWSWL